MAISYPVSRDSRWGVYQVSTGEIVARNKLWPVLDGSPIPGLDPDFVYLLQTEDARPDYDARVYRIEGNETLDLEANTLATSWAMIKRDTAEIRVAAENVEAQELGKHINLAREAMETRLMVGAILNYIDGLSLPPKVQTQADIYKAKSVKLWKNRDRLNAILADIDAGNEPDLDAGWEADAE